MDWVLTTLHWYFFIFFLGIIFFPITKKLFGNFFDQGYAFAKTIGILILSYSVFVLGSIRILPFTQLSLFLSAAIFGFLNLLVWRKKSTESGIGKRMLALFVFEELLFLISLFFLTYVRGQEPSIRGLEKFMDYGFMNSILRSEYFPPLDMWLSADPAHPNGYPINYYYFGHLTGALLIKLTGVSQAAGYNLILATIFAQGTTLAFSLCSSVIKSFGKVRTGALVFFGLIGSFMVNLAGNLHTIYLFTKGYSSESAPPFWQIFSSFNPTKYWYPNATRFIPFTIHEFPSYSYVVADLHGHVFDIPFVLLTLALLFRLFLLFIDSFAYDLKHKTLSYSSRLKARISISKLVILSSAAVGFMTAIHYMTNAFDGPIYLLLAFLVYIMALGLSKDFLKVSVLTIAFFVLFSLPFSINFSPFVSGIGFNCSPDFLVKMGKIGPFLFEKDKCQASALWMMGVLWGFFFINFLIFSAVQYFVQKEGDKGRYKIVWTDQFVFLLFGLGTILIIIPEFFYIKDIYPAHFRANTMFKLGYQAFIMMSVASAYTVFKITTLLSRFRYPLAFIFLLMFGLIFLYPFHSFPSYYGDLKKKPELDGSIWLTTNSFLEDYEIINYMNKNIKGQPVILEAQGDSYTDYERISAYTGLPTVAGWWVHEWLWRGSSEIVGNRIPDVALIYETEDIKKTQELIKKYKVKYIVVSKLEKEKYKKLNEEALEVVGTKIFKSSDGFGALYQVK